MIRIMFVDDEKAIRDNLSRLVTLESEEYQVVGTAMNGADALEKIPDMKPDVIFLDISMPVMDGLTFLKQLKKSENSNIEIVILSGYNDFEYAKTAMRYGARAYLSKPVDEEEMAAILQEINASRQKDQVNSYSNQLMQKVEEVKRLYRGGSMVRNQFEGYFLIHIVVLAEKQDEYTNPIEEKLQYGLVRSRGCVYSYLVSKKELDSCQHDYKKYCDTLISQLNTSGKQCAVLVDQVIFEDSLDAFRKEFDSHLYYMMTELFYRQDISYCNMESIKIENTFHRPDCEEKFLSDIKRGLKNLDWYQLESNLEQLFEDMERDRIALENVQEIVYRMYYLVIDLFPELDCRQSDFWENTCFTRFDLWKKKEMEWMKHVYRSCKDSVKQKCQGVGGEAVSWIMDHYREPITLKQVADKFFLNTAYMGRIFQKTTGICFKQYVNDLRTEEAKRLLVQTDKMIYEIAEQIGYTESKYFIAKFTEKVGLSPSEYRKKNNKKYDIQ